MGDGIIGFGDREREQLETINLRFEQNYREELKESHEPKREIDEDGLVKVITAGITAGIRAQCNANLPSRASATLPTLKEFREEWRFLSQRQAADFLQCDTRTIRNYLSGGKLTRAGRGKVSCDDKWARMIRKNRPDYRVM